jgi:HD-GYP domain-containing protein (c-di-GMP phosphodiesterase class II)
MKHNLLVRQEDTIIRNTLGDQVTYYDRQHRIIWANEAMPRATKATAACIVGKHCYQVRFGIDRICAGCPMEKVFLTGKPGQTLINDTDAAYQLQWIPIRDCNGLVTNIVEIKSCITEKIKRAEERQYIDGGSLRNIYLASLQQKFGNWSRELETHIRRIKVYAVQLGVALKLGQARLDNLSLAAFLHDIGKVALPQKVILKKDCLTDEEKVVLKGHPEIGYRIIMALHGNQEVAATVRAQHEQWDGHGYPRGIAGKEIPLTARIISLIHAYDDLIGGRFYQRPRSHQQALMQIERDAGTKYDPELAAIYLRIMNGINA